MKKLFSIIATFALLATTVVNVPASAAYSAELEEAYGYAYGMGITTMTSIDNADMYGTLTRVALAKMVSNYVIELGLQNADVSKECEFTDVSAALDAQYGNWVTNACQLGLMGVGIDSFRPFDTVTRAEFGTVLSRAIWGDANNGSDPYYTAHLNALKDEGIMTNISNPNMKEVRGYVMLMMQRADENGVASGKPAICNTPENILACSLELDSCPAECLVDEDEEEEVEVKAGTLKVSLGDSLADGSQIPSTGIVRFATVNFKASSDDVNLKTVEIKKIGLASIPSSTRVWFEKDGKRISGRSSFTSEGVAIISFAPVYTVKAGNTESLDLYVELATTDGKDFKFASLNIDSTAEDVAGSFTTPTLRTADYTVAGVTFNVAGGGGSSSVTTNGMELGQFSLQNTNASSEERDLVFKSIMLRQTSAADLSNLDDIILERNGEIVSKDVDVDGKYITFTVSDTIKNATTATYTIKAVINDVETSSDDYTFELRNTTDLNVIEKDNGFRSPINAIVLTLNTYSIVGSDLTFARDVDTELTDTVSAGSEVVLMKGTISSKTAITLEDPTVFTTAGTTGLNDLFTTVYLKIGSSVFSYSPTATDTGAMFVGSATIDGTASVKMYATLKDTAAGNIEFKALKLSSFQNPEYVSNGVTVATSVGSIAGISVEIQDTNLNITRTDGIGGTTVMAAGSDNITTFEAKLSSNQGNGVKVTKATFDVAADASYNNNAYFTLYVDGVAKQTKTLSGTSITFDNFSTTVDSDNDSTLKVEADFTETVSGSIQLTLASVVATDLGTSNNLSAISPVAGAMFTVGTANGVLAISQDVVLSKLLLSPSTNQKIAAVKVTAENDKVRLYNLTLTATGVDTINNIRLVRADGTTVASASSVSGSMITFENLANTAFVEKDLSITYDVVADINTNVSTAADLQIAVSTGNVRASNGLTAGSLNASSLVANAHKVLDRTIVVAKLDNPNKSLTTSAMRFSVTANGKDVNLSGVTAILTAAGYDGVGSDLTVKLYKNTVSAANEVTGPTTIDAGTTVTFIVAVPGALINSTSSSQDWIITLSAINIDSLNVAPYTNVGEFPMTERK